ncbi:MAG: hypothetical protein HY890_03690 [Deltaproteobacteria bacterium]|nr:hypothetical protein [Deltaproteobacteria bacterium]
MAERTATLTLKLRDELKDLPRIFEGLTETLELLRSTDAPHHMRETLVETMAILANIAAAGATVVDKES